MNNSIITINESIKEITAFIQKLYLEDEIPWVIGYSGGKDSTATLQLTWYAIQQLPAHHRIHKTIHVISTDTLVESPVVAAWVEQSLEKMKHSTAEQAMPFEVHRLTPKPKDSYWVNLIGRGYPAPRTNFRWCTNRLKIEPANRFILDVIEKHGEAILLLGTRKAESSKRAATMKKYESKRVRDLLSPNGELPNSLVFSPIEDWSNDEVWFYLMQNKNPWDHSNKELLAMYSGASTDGECPIVLDTSTPSCGNSRFGCWICTLVEQDKSMAAMIQNDDEKAWMMPLLELRNEIGNWEEDRKRRDFRRMTGRLKLHTDKQGIEKLVHGPYTKDFREHWLRRLLSVQKHINQNGPIEFKNLKLITDDELKEIRRIWRYEKHCFDDMLPNIYEEVLNEKYPYENEIPIGNFGFEEWNLLKEITNELYPDEGLLFELQYSAIDIEQQSIMLSLRKGILNELEERVRKCYYKNESDAEQYKKTIEKRSNADEYLDEDIV